MSALDALYGDGASGEFADQVSYPEFDDPEIVEVENEPGEVAVVVTWGDADMKIICWDERVHFSTLRSGREVPTGLYTALCDSIPAWFKSKGVRDFTASPHDQAAREILRSRGEWEPWGDRLRWVL